MKKLISSLIITAFLSSCATTENSERTAGKNTGMGAGIGAAVGAAAGAMLGKKGKKGKSALIGGVLGGLVGGGTGYYFDKQAKELEKIAETQRTKDGIITKLKGDITFAPNKSQVKNDAKESISQIANIISSYPEDILTVKGYTDSDGSYEWNQKLSAMRADSVRAELIAGGVPASSISTVGMGPGKPIADNSTAAGKSANRRVEIEITVDESKIKKK
jgi:outer membrane protein OmpA-like peptidoglycan-associated protein